MIDYGLFGTLLIIINIAFSYKGFTNTLFFEAYKFEVDKVLINKDYLRLISSGFLHTNWNHLIFNMLSLYFFSGPLENQVGGLNFLLIYFTSLIAGNLFALIIHKNHGDYCAVGASGAICGIIFASIALFPSMEIGLLLLPFSVPGWLFGILYIAYTFFGIKTQKDNIGHEAHLGGALIGMLVAIIIQPSALKENYPTIILILLPSVFLIALFIKKPHVLLIETSFKKIPTKYYDIDHKYNEEKKNKEIELDELLEKINKKGINNLSKKERQRLDELSSQ